MADLDDIQARYGTIGPPENFPISAVSGTSDVVAIAAVAGRRILVELVDVVASAAADVGIRSGAVAKWGPIPAAANMQYTASDILGEPGASITLTRGSATALGGGGVYRLVGPAPT